LAQRYHFSPGAVYKHGGVSSPSPAAMEIATFSWIILYDVVAGGDAE